jgi:predicted alpha/beta hydrolase family esterase
MARHALVVHGSYGSPAENWFPWLYQHLEDAGVATVVPTFPTPENQSLTTWRETLSAAVGELSPDWLLFGHSIGVAFLLDLLGRTAQPAAALFAVSGFTGLLGIDEFDAVNASFIAQEPHWSHVRALVGQSFVYQGDDDPYVPQYEGPRLAAKLGAIHRVIPYGGHLNAAAGYASFELLWSDVQHVLDTMPPT